MRQYRIHYYYLATGMEGVPDERFTVILANNAADAVIEYLNKYETPSKSLVEWVLSCITVEDMVTGHKNTGKDFKNLVTVFERR